MSSCGCMSKVKAKVTYNASTRYSYYFESDYSIKRIITNKNSSMNFNKSIKCISDSIQYILRIHHYFYNYMCNDLNIMKIINVIRRNSYNCLLILSINDLHTECL